MFVFCHCFGCPFWITSSGSPYGVFKLFLIFMKRQFIQWWSTISPILTTTSHHKSLNINKNSTWKKSSAVFGHTQICVGVQLVNGITTLSPLDFRMSNSNTDMFLLCNSGYILTVVNHYYICFWWPMFEKNGKINPKKLTKIKKKTTQNSNLKKIRETRSKYY